MEMHQIRYFLATARTLNFTRAAQECNVAQPSLTRAIKLLEDELGGELLRRERNLSHLTELGQRMLPLLQQCYDSAQHAKSLAGALKAGAVAPLSLALSSTVRIERLVPHLGQLVRSIPGLELRFVRGTRDEIGEALKQGEAELAIAGPLGSSWDRFDSWPLFTDALRLMVGLHHPFANRASVTLAELKGERLLRRSHCELCDQLDNRLREAGVDAASGHTLVSDHDLPALVAAGLGVAIAPVSLSGAADIRSIGLLDLEIEHTVHAYAVSGRARSPAASTLLKVLRAADWSERTR